MTRSLSADEMEIVALLERLHAAMQRAGEWTASHVVGDGRGHSRLSVAREMVVNNSGRPCGCDPGAGWTCERHQHEEDIEAQP